MTSIRMLAAAIVGLAFMVGPTWRSVEPERAKADSGVLYDYHTQPRVSRSLSTRTRVIRYAYTHYSSKNAKAFVEIIWRESRFIHTATNKETGAYGLGQAKPPSKMESVGSDWRSNPYTQLEWVARYIKERYDNPMNALLHHNRKGWY